MSFIPSTTSSQRTTTSTYSSLWHAATMNAATIATSTSSTLSLPPTRLKNQHPSTSGSNNTLCGAKTLPLHRTRLDNATQSISVPSTPQSNEPRRRIPPICLTEASLVPCNVHLDSVKIEKPVHYEIDRILDVAAEYYKKLWDLSPRPTPFPHDIGSVQSVEVLEGFLGKKTVSLFMMPSRLYLSTPSGNFRGLAPIFVPCIHFWGNPGPLKLTWSIILAIHMCAQKQGMEANDGTAFLSPNGSIVRMLSPDIIKKEASAFVEDFTNFDVSRLSCEIVFQGNPQDPVISTMGLFPGPAGNKVYINVAKPHECCVHEGFRSLISAMPDNGFNPFFTNTPTGTALKRPLVQDEERPLPLKRRKTCNGFDPSGCSSSLLKIEIDVDNYWALSENDRQGLSDYLDREVMLYSNQRKEDVSSTLPEFATGKDNKKRTTSALARPD